jgi:hypothetical protein
MEHINTLCGCNVQVWNVLADGAYSKLCAIGKKKGKLYPCTGTEALYRPYGP